MPFESKKKLPARPCDSFQPVVNSWRKPSETVRRELTRMESSANQAPSSDRQPSGVGVGTVVNVPTVPCKKAVRLVNVAWPYWPSASLSFDWTRWNQTPALH